MITKVRGEAPFQVLTNNFSISPSNEGYTLQISADGENYSNLFSVGANVTRLVTGVAANSYYRLLGNNSEVTINWMKTCVTEGGGGDMSNYYTKDETDALIESALTSGVSLDGYWDSGETKEYVDSADTAILAEVGSLSAVVQEQQIVFSSGYNELHTQVQELSARTPDLSAYYTSAQTEQAITSKNYVTSAQVETQITGKNYITSAYTGYAPVALTGDVQSLSGAVVDAQSAITIMDEVVSDALNDLNAKVLIISANTPDISGLQARVEDVEMVTASALTELHETKVASSTIRNMVALSQADYDITTQSGATADPYTFYIITGTTV